MVHELLTQLNTSGIVIRLNEEGNLAVTAPKGAMTPSIAEQIKNNKSKIVAFLNNGANQAAAPAFPPITPIERGEYLPISLAQERLWWAEQLSPGTAVYNLPFAFRLKGPLDVEKLERSLQLVIQRHETLQIQFKNVNGKPVGQLVQHLPEALPIIPLDTIPEDEQDEALQNLLDQHSQIPFDLSDGPLFRAMLFRLNPEDHVFLFLVHHIIFDGWSGDVLWRELASFYQEYPSIDAPLPIQYADFASWQRDWLESESAKSDLQFWKDNLQNPIESLSLPVNRTVNSKQSFYEAEELNFEIPENLTSQIQKLAQRERASSFMVLLAAYKATLHAYTHQEDMVVCTPIVGRMVTALDDLIGYFNNIVVLRTNLAQDPTFAVLLERVRQTVLAANEHQTIPFQNVAELPNVRTIPLMRALFVLQDSVGSRETIPGITSSTVSVQRYFDYADMSIELNEVDGQFKGTLWFKKALFDSATMQSFIENYLAILHEVVGNPNQPLSSLPSFDMPLRESSSIGSTNTITENERPFTLPETPTEIKLAEIWRDLLDYEPVNIHDDFFEVGGHSLLAIRFFDRIETITGKQLPLAILFEAPTIAKLAAILQDDSWEPKKRTVVNISGHDSETQSSSQPFYCVIPPGDELLIFNDLAKEMGNERPFLGLQYGVQGEKPFTAVEDMAAYFVEKISNHDSQEPYLLGGYCFGGLIAYEMAQQLISKGHKVALVALIDTNVPGSVMPVQEKHHIVKVFKDRLAGLIQNGLMHEIRYISERMASTWKFNIWQPIWSKAHKFYANSDRTWPKIVRDFYLINQNASEKYQVTPYSGNVVLLQAVDRLDFYEYEPHLGWDRYAAGDFVDHFIPGTHELLLRNPNAQKLAQELQTAISNATQSKRPLPKEIYDVVH
jgi:thioesterase domain-containing protein